MEDIINAMGSVTSPKGFKAAGVKAGLKRSGAPDMAMIYSERPCNVAAAFTSNLFAAAPVVYDREIIAKQGCVHAVVVNSGNANACTGEAGLADARKTAAKAAELLGCKPAE
ncbi:MAG: bifunctional ornithine acetyltransferase/N-acetylglutamate synthase, partial [Victivallales bacterium]|nr:bifunctional ornithine acetyltransferase/N-acetylglutamate synthase [Victivallales bacterium]